MLNFCKKENKMAAVFFKQMNLWVNKKDEGIIIQSRQGRSCRRCIEKIFRELAKLETLKVFFTVAIPFFRIPLFHFCSRIPPSCIHL